MNKKIRRIALDRDLQKKIVDAVTEFRSEFTEDKANRVKALIDRGIVALQVEALDLDQEHN